MHVKVHCFFFKLGFHIALVTYVTGMEPALPVMKICRITTNATVKAGTVFFFGKVPTVKVVDGIFCIVSDRA